MNIAFRPRLFSSADVKCDFTGSDLLQFTFLDIASLFQQRSEIHRCDRAESQRFSQHRRTGSRVLQNVEILGVRFSLGDDCIAVKSGKSTWAKAQDSFREHPHPPVPDGERSRCCNSGQRDGRRRGESDGGGLHFPSYGQRPAYQDPPRQRKDAILSNIIFRNLTLDHVMTPLVVNCFYFCDPDGKTTYVQSRDVYPVDDRTPQVKRWY